MKDRVYNLFRITGEYSLYGLLFFLPISNALVESFVGMAILSFLCRKGAKPDASPFNFWPNIFLSLFFLFSALSLFNSYANMKISLSALFGKWLEYLSICIIFQDSIYDEKVIKRGLGVFLSGATLAVLSGLSQYFFSFEFLRHRNVAITDGGLRAVTSSFAHYNGFASYLLVVIATLFIFLLLSKGSRLRFYGLITLSLLSIAALFLTLSRGSWLALFVSISFMAILLGRDSKRLIPVILIIFAMFFIPLFRERLLFIFNEYGDSARIRFWTAALRMVCDHPFLGTGVGTFMANFSSYLPSLRISYAHNCYLQILAETGIFSLISFLGFVTMIIYYGIKKLYFSRDFLLLGLLSGLVAMLVHSFFEVNLYSLQLAVLFWVWCGLIIARLNTPKQNSKIP